MQEKYDTHFEAQNSPQDTAQHRRGGKRLKQATSLEAHYFDICLHSP